MPFTEEEYLEVIQKNEIVKEAYDSIIETCANLQKQTNCPQEDVEDFLKFIAKKLSN